MSPLTPEQQEQLGKVFAESFAKDAERAKEKRMKTGELEIDLDSAPDDPPINSDTIQEELAQFGRALASAEVAYAQTAIAFDSVEAHGYPLAEFVIKTLGPSAIGVVTAAVTGWFAGRAGRKARLKFGDVEAEARTPEEVDQLLKSAAEYRDRIEKNSNE